MTPEQLREAAAVMLAASEGKAVQWRERLGRCEKWNMLSDYRSATWDWRLFEYRINPEPKKVKVQVYCDGYYYRACTSIEKPREHWRPVSDIVEIEIKDE